MKKQTNLPASGRKLSLNKKTISNLQPEEMNKKIGGQARSYWHGSCWGYLCGNHTWNGKNCGY